MQVLPATIAHSSTLASLERACFAEPWSEKTLAAALEDERYVVLLAADADNIPGYILGWNVGPEAELARVGVLEPWRGRGLGAALTRAVLQEWKGRGVETVFLEVRDGNLAARKLYERCGFIQVGERDNYYTDGEAAIVMRLELV